MQESPRILFFCAGNSCRSQIAEGWARHLLGDKVEVYSAGLRVSEVDPIVMNLMQAAGVDITRQQSKALSAVRHIRFDYIFCLSGDELPPEDFSIGDADVIHAYFDDPPELAARADSEEQAFEEYIRIRDEIRVFVEGLPEILALDDP